MAYELEDLAQMLSEDMRREPSSALDRDMLERLALAYMTQPRKWEECRSVLKQHRLLREVERNVKQLAQELGEIRSFVGSDTSETGVPEVWTGPDELRVADEVLQALSLTEDFYQRGGALVGVGTDDDGAHVVRRLSKAALRERMSDVVHFVTMNKAHRKVRTYPPSPVVAAIHERGHWDGPRVLQGIVDYPVLAPSGRIVCTPGYDTETRLLVADSIVPPSLAGTIDRDRVDDAVLRLTEPFCDYEFSSKCGGASVVVSLIMSLLARPSIDGPVPLHAFDSSTRGAGKGLLLFAGAIVGSNREPLLLPWMRDEAEQDKRVTSVLLSAAPVAAIDDAKRALGGAILDPLLTAWPRYNGRLLNTNEITAPPATTIWSATGVNLKIEDHTVRRVVMARIEPRCERPEDRDDFRFPELLEHIKLDRHGLREAALTILTAYQAAGRPPQNLRAMGSYSAWSRVVRSAIVWAGLPDPARGREEIEATSDDLEAHKMLLGDEGLLRLIETKGIGDPGKTRGITSKTIQKALDTGAPEWDVVADALGKIAKKKLDSNTIGYALRKLKGRPVGGRVLTIAESTAKKGALWRVAEVDSEEFA